MNDLFTEWLTQESITAVSRCTTHTGQRRTGTLCEPLCIVRTVS